MKDLVFRRRVARLFDRRVCCTGPSRPLNFSRLQLGGYPSDISYISQLLQSVGVQISIAIFILSDLSNN